MRLAAFFAAAVVAAAVRPSEASALWDYVNYDDGAFSWFDTGYRLNGSDWTGYLLNMTSQNWLTPEEVSISTWTHQLLVVVPTTITNFTTAAMYITGGSNPEGNPGIDDEDVLFSVIAATATNTICATLWQVPNQPIVFAADPTHAERIEDDAVGWTWYWYGMNEDVSPEYVLYLPMAKAASKALTAVEEFAAKNVPGAAITKHFVAGASKRGATTWLVTAADDRVMASAPIVFDLLNMTEGLQSHFQSLGGWSFAFEPYWVLNLTTWFGTSKWERVREIVDPIQYAANLSVPVLVCDSTGDEFFILGDSWPWWGSLPGEKYRLMIANAEHTMATGVVPLMTGIVAFYTSTMLNTPRPSFDWVMDHENATTTLDVNTYPVAPAQVVMRWGDSTGPALDQGRRDFRLIKGNTPADPCHFVNISLFGSACLNPVIYLGDTLQPTSTYTDPEGHEHQVYVMSQDAPAAGFYRGWFADLYFPGVLGTTFRMTTQVNIVPNTFPFEWVTGIKGNLV